MASTKQTGRKSYGTKSGRKKPAAKARKRATATGGVRKPQRKISRTISVRTTKTISYRQSSQQTIRKPPIKRAKTQRPKKKPSKK